MTVHSRWLPSGLFAMLLASQATSLACAQQDAIPRFVANAAPDETRVPRDVQNLVFFERLRDLTPEEAGSIGVFFQSPEYYIVRDRVHLDVRKSEGLTWIGEWFGEAVTQAHLDEGRRGVVVNLTGGSIPLSLHGANASLSSKGIIFIESVTAPEPQADPRGGDEIVMCNVTGCDGTNYSACCVYDGAGPGKNTCKCLPNSQVNPQSCDAGGLSASGCSLP